MMIIIMPNKTDSRGGQKSNWAIRRHQSQTTGRHYRLKREFKINHCIIYLHVHTQIQLFLIHYICFLCCLMWKHQQILNEVKLTTII